MCKVTSSVRVCLCAVEINACTHTNICWDRVEQVVNKMMARKKSRTGCRNKELGGGGTLSESKESRLEGLESNRGGRVRTPPRTSRTGLPAMFCDSLILERRVDAAAALAGKYVSGDRAR